MWKLEKPSAARRISAPTPMERYVGMAFGYYGLAWSVYSSVFAHGGDVQFDKNAAMDVKFGARPPSEGPKFLQGPEPGTAQ